MATIPDQYLDLLQQKKAFAELATLMPDGSPQVTPVWFDYTGGVIRVNSAKGRTKTRNMKEGAPVALSIMDPDNPYRYLQVRGNVTRVTEEGASAHIELTGEEVSWPGQVSVVAPGRGAGDIRDHAERRARDGLSQSRGNAMQNTQQITGTVGGRVEILRDHSGVPHVYAASTPDLYFGLGMAMAQDRLWQMDRLRRRALGRQAEILGAAYIASDIAHLTVGIDEISNREAGALDEKTQQVVAALVAGINRQIELFGRDLPPEFRRLDYVPEPFAVRDVVAIARGIWWSLNGRIDRIVAAEAARMLPEAFRGCT